MSNRTYILGFITLIVLLFSPGGFFGASIQLVLVIGVAISIVKDMNQEQE